MNFKINTFIWLCLYFTLPCVSQNKSGAAWCYGGINNGLYRFSQSPLETRAWEFNNYLNVTKPMKVNKSFGGYNFGAIINLSASDGEKIGFPLGIEYGFTHNKSSGVRDSSGISIERNLNEKMRGFYFGIGISSPTVSKITGRPFRFTFGYLPYFSLNKISITDNTLINGSEQKTTATMKGSVIILKSMVYINYQLSKHVKLGLYPYIENHVFDGAATVIYNDPTKHITFHELYNLKKMGATLCLGYSF